MYISKNVCWIMSVFKEEQYGAHGGTRNYVCNTVRTLFLTSTCMKHQHYIIISIRAAMNSSFRDSSKHPSAVASCKQPCTCSFSWAASLSERTHLSGGSHKVLERPLGRETWKATNSPSSPMRRRRRRAFGKRSGSRFSVGWMTLDD